MPTSFPSFITGARRICSFLNMARTSLIGSSGETEITGRDILSPTNIFTSIHTSSFDGNAHKPTPTWFLRRQFVKIITNSLYVLLYGLVSSNWSEQGHIQGRQNGLSVYAAN